MVQRSKGNGPYAPLSATYYRDDALLEAGEAAELLYVRGLAYCAEALSDGFISDRQVDLIVGVGMKDAMKRAERLVAVDLWERVEGGYVVRSWSKWNKTAEEIGRHRKMDRERKARKAGSGIQSDSARNPDGIPTDSAPQSTTQHNTVLTPTVPTVVGDTESMTVTQRSKRITDAYAQVEPMCKWPAVNAVAIKAIKSGKWSDDEIRDALLRLAKEGRGVTVETVRVELQGFAATARSPQQDQTEALFSRAEQRLANRTAVNG